jgi:hypothetical protein
MTVHIHVGGPSDQDSVSTSLSVEDITETEMSSVSSVQSKIRVKGDSMHINNMKKLSSYIRVKQPGRHDAHNVSALL